MYIYVLWFSVSTGSKFARISISVSPQVRRKIVPAHFNAKWAPVLCVTSMHSVGLCSVPGWRGSSLKRDPVPSLAPSMVCPWADLAENNNTCTGLWVLHPYQVSSTCNSGEGVKNVKYYGRQMDDRRIAGVIEESIPYSELSPQKVSI